MMKKLKETISAYKRKAQFERESEIKAQFEVVERKGNLWLTHNGVAFMKVASLAKAEDVAKDLNNARECAVEFIRI